MSTKYQIFLVEDNISEAKLMISIIEKHFPDFEVVWAKTKDEINEKWHNGFIVTIADCMGFGSKTGIQWIIDIQHKNQVTQMIIGYSTDPRMENIGDQYPTIQGIFDKNEPSWIESLINLLNECVYLKDLDKEIALIKSLVKTMEPKFLDEDFNGDRIVQNFTFEDFAQGGMDSIVRGNSFKNKDAVVALDNDEVKDEIKSELCKNLFKKITKKKLATKTLIQN